MPSAEAEMAPGTGRGTQTTRTRHQRKPPTEAARHQQPARTQQETGQLACAGQLRRLLVEKGLYGRRRGTRARSGNKRAAPTAGGATGPTSLMRTHVPPGRSRGLLILRPRAKPSAGLRALSASAGSAGASTGAVALRPRADRPGAARSGVIARDFGRYLDTCTARPAALELGVGARGWRQPGSGSRIGDSSLGPVYRGAGRPGEPTSARSSPTGCVPSAFATATGWRLAPGRRTGTPRPQSPGICRRPGAVTRLVQ